MRASIRTQVIALALIPMGIFGGLLIGLLAFDYTRDLDAALKSRAMAMARQLASVSAHAVAASNTAVLKTLLAETLDVPDVLGTGIYDLQGRAVETAGHGLESGYLERVAQARGDLVHESPHKLVFRAPILAPDAARQADEASLAQLGWAVVAVSRAGVSRGQQTVFHEGLGLIAIGLAVSLLLAWRIGRQIILPIRALSHTVSRISEGALEERASTGSAGELGLLEQGINRMAARLQSAREHLQEQIDQATARLIYQASHDALTGLINRREFELRLERALQTALQQERSHVLCYLDLDQFKVINDTCGHIAGDELLCQLAVLLKAKLRERDTLARLGGDEFALLLENCALKDALEVANFFRAEIQRFRFRWKERVFTVGVSVGVVEITPHSGSVADVLSAADAACYVAKDRGRNQIHVYEPRDTDLVRHRSEMLWATRMQRAIEEGRLRLVWQAIVPVHGESPDMPLHVELLVRMEDEDGSLVLPMAFIPAAERYFIMPALDGWVVSEALAIARLCRTRAPQKTLLLGVNLSGASLKDPSFRDMLLVKLSEQPEIGQSLCFEITETAAIGNLAVVNGFIQTMRGHGCRFALDDFGSGLSSFNYLKNLQVDYLKIDGAFVHDLAHNPVDRAMVESVHRIAHLIGLETVAEFVDSPEALAVLAELGVDHAQGNHLHRPEAITTLYERLRGSR